MMASPKLPATEEPTDSSSSTPMPTSQRKALGDASSLRHTTRTTRASSSTPSSTPIIQQTTRPQTNARMQVFVDPSPKDVASPVANEDDTSPWPDLGTRKSRIKENIKEATKAAGTTLPQTRRAQRSTPSQGAPKISVYRDPVLQEDEETTADMNSHEMPPPPLPAGGSKSTTGRSIAVFRDEDTKAAPAIKKAKSSSKSSIPVFRDEDTTSRPTPPAHSKVAKAKVAGKTAIPVFRDDSGPSTAAASRPTKGKVAGKGAIAVFRDEDPDTENDSSTKPKKTSIAVFRDEPRMEASSSTKQAKGKLAVFRDGDVQGTVGSPGKRSIGKIAVFSDELETSEPSGGATTKAKGKIPVFRDETPAPSKSKISVFRDEEAAPSFTPYRDEDVGYALLLVIVGLLTLWSRFPSLLQRWEGPEVLAPVVPSDSASQGSEP